MGKKGNGLSLFVCSGGRIEAISLLVRRGSGFVLRLGSRAERSVVSHIFSLLLTLSAGLGMSYSNSVLGYSYVLPLGVILCLLSVLYVLFRIWASDLPQLVMTSCGKSLK